MKRIFEIIFLFSVCYLCYQKPVYSYEFTAIITESYDYYHDSWGEFYEGEIRRDGWHVGDTFSGDFVYDPFDYTGDGRGGEATSVSFLDKGFYEGRITITNSHIDTFIFDSFVEFGGGIDEFVRLTITDPTGTLTAGNSDEGLPDSLNMANSTLFDVQIEYSTSYEGPGNWSSRVLMSAVGHFEPVPLPSVLLLFGSGLAGLIVVSRKCQKAIVSNIRPG